MATSTFSKHFEVRPKKAAAFVSEMTRTVAPTLRKDFKSQSVNLFRDKDVKEKLQKVLGK